MLKYVGGRGVSNKFSMIEWISLCWKAALSETLITLELKPSSYDAHKAFFFFCSLWYSYSCCLHFTLHPETHLHFAANLLVFWTWGIVYAQWGSLTAHPSANLQWLFNPGGSESKPAGLCEFIWSALFFKSPKCSLMDPTSLSCLQ